MKPTEIGCRFARGLGLLLCGFLFLSRPPTAVGDKPTKKARPSIEQFLKQLVFGVIPLVYEDGLLGCVFLMRHSCVIDCADRRPYLRNSALKAEAQDVLERSLSQSGYRSMPLSPTTALVLACDAKINARPVKLLVDTGASFTALDDEPVMRCGLSWSETGMQNRGVGKIGRTKILAARLRSFEIGGVELSLRGFEVGGAEMVGWISGSQLARRQRSLDRLPASHTLVSTGDAGCQGRRAICESAVKTSGHRFFLVPPEPHRGSMHPC